MQISHLPGVILTQLLTTRPRGSFLESTGNFSGLESCFVFVVFAFEIKV